MDTYVVVGENYDHDQTSTMIDYAGCDKEEAFALENPEAFDSIRVMVFRNGSRIMEFKHQDGYWAETYNLITTLEKDISDYQEKVNILTNELESLRD